MTIPEPTAASGLVDRALAGLASQVCRRPLRLILAFTLLSLVMGRLATRLHLVTEMGDLIPRDNPRVQVFERIKHQVGSTTPLLITITGDDLEATVAFMSALADSLDHRAFVGWTLANTHRRFFLGHRLLYMGLEDLRTLHDRVADFIDEQTLRQSPLYVGLDDDPVSIDLADLEAHQQARLREAGLQYDQFVTGDGRGVVLRLFPDGDNTDIRFARALLDSVRATVARLGPERYGADLRVDYSGSFVNQLYDLDRIITDARLAAVVGVIGVLLLIMVYFRQVLAPLFIVVPLGMSLLWTFGLTYLVIGSLNQVTVILFGVLFGLGIDFGIHILSRYEEARRRGQEVEAAVRETLTRTGRALAAAAATTSLAFYSLMVTDFKGFSQAGFIAGTGTLLSLLAMMVLAPAFIVLDERLGWICLGGPGPVRLKGRSGPFPWPRLTAALCLLPTVVAVVHLSELSFDFDFSHLRFAPPAPASPLPDHLKAVNSPAIVLTESASDAREVVRLVEAERARRGSTSTVGSVLSVHSLLPADQHAKLALIADLRRRVDGLASEDLEPQQQARLDSLRPLLDARALTLPDLPRDWLQPFRGKDGEILEFVAIHPSVPLQDGQVVARFADEIGRLRTPSGHTYYASSSNLVFSDMMRVVIHDARPAVSLALGVVLLVVFLLLRRLSLTLLAVLPLLVGLSWVLGAMYLFGIRFNFYNSIVFPSVIGIGIDNGIYILHRYLEEGQGSLQHVLRTTGKALLATSLTTMAGFSGLLLGQHPGLRSIGSLALIGLGACLVTALTLLPAVLQLLDRAGHLRPNPRPANRTGDGP